MTKQPSGVPDLEAAKAAFAKFCTTIAALRDPDDGCPWDIEQTHQSLRRFMIEEAYEAAHAMSEDDDREICDELGDVLLQVVLNGQVAKDRGAFSIVDVIEAIDSKMHRRHPHVFGDEEERKDNSVSTIKNNWQKIKEQEKAAHSDGKEKRYFDSVKGKIPALTQSLEIGKKAAKIKFDWDHPSEVLDQVISEVEELKAECADTAVNREKVRNELGDVFFSLAQLARHYGFDPETVAFDANRKFLLRFESLEDIAKSQGVKLDSASRDQLESLWQEAKGLEQD